MTEFINNCILLKTLKPYQWIFAIFGLNLPPFLLSQKEKDLKYQAFHLLYLFYTVLLIILAVWCSHDHIVLVMNATSKYDLDGLTKLSAHIQSVLIVILQLQTIYKIWFNSQTLKNILQTIENMETKSPFHLREQQLLRRLLSRTGLCIIVLSVLLFYLNFQLIVQNMFLPLRLANIFSLMSVQLKSLEYGIYVQVIYEFLEQLFKSLKNLKEKIDKESWKRLEPLSFYYVKGLKQNQLLLLEINSLVEKLEQYFAWPILMLFFFNGLSILCTVNWGYVRYTYETQNWNQFCKYEFYLKKILYEILLKFFKRDK